ncbi:unnamed protein product [Amoebophrya sp. A25]|nr:unnamed protein product [Amoebophrya sp. A25]|eukprot:GSA25T00026896001.1
MSCSQSLLTGYNCFGEDISEAASHLAFAEGVLLARSGIQHSSKLTASDVLNRGRGETTGTSENATSSSGNNVTTSEIPLQTLHYLRAAKRVVDVYNNVVTRFLVQYVGQLLPFRLFTAFFVDLPLHSARLSLSLTRRTAAEELGGTSERVQSALAMAEEYLRRLDSVDPTSEIQAVFRPSRSVSSSSSSGADDPSSLDDGPTLRISSKRYGNIGSGSYLRWQHPRGMWHEFFGTMDVVVATLERLLGSFVRALIPPRHLFRGAGRGTSDKNVNVIYQEQQMSMSSTVHLKTTALYSPHVVVRTKKISRQRNSISHFL